VSYDSLKPVEFSISEVKKQLPSPPYDIIGHSLGGLIAYTISASEIHGKLVTISSPFGGSIAASRLKWFNPHVPILTDICPNSKFVKGLLSKKLRNQHLALISTRGSNFFTFERNDGVITYSSQCIIKHQRQVEIEANHFEIVQHAETIFEIDRFLSGEN
jgi:hypothetical protein